VHRDFKSGNVMLVPAGEGEPPRVVVTDFGLARSSADVSPAVSTASGFVLGTPAYIAPEQVEGEEATAAVDQYALGVVMFEMLTGRLPFHDPDPLKLMAMHAKSKVPRLDDVTQRAVWATPELCALIAGALVKDPRNRFASAEAMIEALDAAFYSIDHLGDLGEP